MRRQKHAMEMANTTYNKNIGECAENAKSILAFKKTTYLQTLVKCKTDAFFQFFLLLLCLMWN